MIKRIFHVLLVILLTSNFILSACQPVEPVPVPYLPPTDWQEIRLQADLDDWLGPYAPERLWGNPREAISNDGWSFHYEMALTTPYRTGEDDIAIPMRKIKRKLPSCTPKWTDAPWLRKYPLICWKPTLKDPLILWSVSGENLNYLNLCAHKFT